MRIYLTIYRNGKRGTQRVDSREAGDGGGRALAGGADAERCGRRGRAREPRPDCYGAPTCADARAQNGEAGGEASVGGRGVVREQRAARGAFGGGKFGGRRSRQRPLRNGGVRAGVRRSGAPLAQVYGFKSTKYTTTNNAAPV